MGGYTVDKNSLKCLQYKVGVTTSETLPTLIPMPSTVIDFEVISYPISYYKQNVSYVVAILADGQIVGLDVNKK